MTSLLFYYFIFITFAIVFFLLLYRFIDYVLDFLQGLIHKITQ